MRKIWAFFGYQNLRKFEKNLKQLDRAPLIGYVMAYGARVASLILRFAMFFAHMKTLSELGSL